MTATNSATDLTEAEKIVVQNYDHDFAALYQYVWDARLGERQEKLIASFFDERQLPDNILDAAAGTGELAVRLAKRGRQVTANELSPAMRHYIFEKRATATLASQALKILDPGVTWRNLPAVFSHQHYDLVLCLGAALAHCDNSRTGNLQDSLLGLASLVGPNGYLLVDCKRYAEDGRELLSDGSKRPLNIDDSSTIDWTDGAGHQRKGQLRSEFVHSSDGSLKRTFRYTEAAASQFNREWVFRTWPVAKAQVVATMATCGLRLIRESVVGGQGMSLPVDTLLFVRTDTPESVAAPRVR